MVRALAGIIGGGLGAAAGWAGSHDFTPWIVATAMVVGALYGLTFRAYAGRALDAAFTGATLGILLWALLDVATVPLILHGRPAWTAAEMRALYPQLVGWICYGLALGAFLHVATTQIERIERAAEPEPAPAPPEPTRVVILGGGFAGMTAALKLEEAFADDASVDLTLVSDANAMLFTPMLAEVAGSSIEPTHISSPLRTSLHRTRVVRGHVAGVLLDDRLVKLRGEPEDTAERELPYDHLVFALGSVSNFFGQESVKAAALDFKTLSDAIRIRNHVIGRFELADRGRDAATRRRLLTFVVAGGGFAGVELAGALNDFARSLLSDYPDLRAEEVRVILVHARERILPELSASLAEYALARMSERGVEFRLGARVVGATAASVALDPPEEIAANTLVWTAGTLPNPLLATLAFERDKRGAVVVEPTLAVPDRPGLWALGDCAAIPDPNGGTCPPTAQHALRQAATLARNLRAIHRGERLRPFAFASLGALCVIGHQTACAEVRVPFIARNLRFSGLLAWAMWRAVYLSKLPGFERKVRVSIDWITELCFPRDTVQTIELR